MPEETRHFSLFVVPSAQTLGIHNDANTKSTGTQQQFKRAYLDVMADHERRGEREQIEEYIQSRRRVVDRRIATRETAQRIRNHLGNMPTMFEAVSTSGQRHRHAMMTSATKAGNRGAKRKRCWRRVGFRGSFCGWSRGEVDENRVPLLQASETTQQAIMHTMRHHNTFQAADCPTGFVRFTEDEYVSLHLDENCQPLMMNNVSLSLDGRPRWCMSQKFTTELFDCVERYGWNNWPVIHDRMLGRWLDDGQYNNQEQQRNSGNTCTSASTHKKGISNQTANSNAQQPFPSSETFCDADVVLPHCLFHPNQHNEAAVDDRLPFTLEDLLYRYFSVCHTVLTARLEYWNSIALGRGKPPAEGSCSEDDCAAFLARIYVEVLQSHPLLQSQFGLDLSFESKRAAISQVEQRTIPTHLYLSQALLEIEGELSSVSEQALEKKLDLVEQLQSEFDLDALALHSENKAHEYTLSQPCSLKSHSAEIVNITFPKPVSPLLLELEEFLEALCDHPFALSSPTNRTAALMHEIRVRMLANIQQRKFISKLQATKLELTEAVKRGKEKLSEAEAMCFL